MAAARQLIPVSLSFPIAPLCTLWHLPLPAYDQVVALSSVRQGEIKHATVTRHTRRIQLQLLTCDIKKPASVRHVDKRDTKSERKGRETWCQKKWKPFNYLLTIILHYRWEQKGAMEEMLQQWQLPTSS